MCTTCDERESRAQASDGQRMMMKVVKIFTILIFSFVSLLHLHDDNEFGSFGTCKSTEEEGSLAVSQCQFF